MRTAMTVAVVAVAGWIVVRLVFGVAGGIVAFLLALAWFALKALLALGILYFALTLIAPETAEKMRAKMPGGGEKL